MEHTRREVLLQTWKVAGAALVGAGVWTTYELLRPLVSSGAGVRLDVGQPGDYAEGTATFVPAGRLYVVNAQGSYFALSQRCPHLGCRVPFCDSSGRFECACHGSIFDLAGEYIKGPSPRGMDRYEMTVEGNSLVVDTGTQIEGPPRGEQKFLTPPSGPSCVEGA